jgi:hypothetical protein
VITNSQNDVILSITLFPTLVLSLDYIKNLTITMLRAKPVVVRPD